MPFYLLLEKTLGSILLTYSPTHTEHIFITNLILLILISIKDMLVVWGRAAWDPLYLQNFKQASRR